MTTLNNAELIAMKVLTAKSAKTAAAWNNKVNTLSFEDRQNCLTLIAKHGDRNKIGYGAIYPNSYLIGGDYK